MRLTLSHISDHELPTTHDSSTGTGENPLASVIPDKNMALDIALCFWYSVFMPAECCITIYAITQQSDETSLRIESPTHSSWPNLSLTCTITKQMCICLGHNTSTSFSAQDIQNQYGKVRNAPSRGDYRDKMYAAPRPSHRIGFLQFHQFGPVIPCGAPSLNL